MLSLFGTSGIRGDASNIFTSQFCFDVGRSFALFLDQNRQNGLVAVGMDPRDSSPRIAIEVESGLIFQGRTLADQGAVAVPAMNWILKESPYAGSIMVTGSHISANLNGLKFFAFKEEISKIHEGKITEIYHKIKGKVKFRKLIGSPEKESLAKESYQEMLVNLAQKNYPCWKIVVDPCNGSQSDIMPQVLKRAGVEVKEINATIQGPFIPRDTETEGALSNLQKIVVKEKSDMGVAYDYDGDRVIFIDEKGRLIPGDYSGALLSKYGDTSLVVTPVNTSQVVEYLDKKVIRTKVGSSYVIEAMKKYQAGFGFEANGGGISAEIMMSRDGGSTTIKILNLLKRTGKKLSQLVDSLPWFYLYRLKIDCPREKNIPILEAVKKKVKGIKSENIDGLKIWLDESTWILFRPSNNASEFRVFAEAKTVKRATQLGKNGLELVKEVIKNG